MNQYGDTGAMALMVGIFMVLMIPLIIISIIRIIGMWKIFEKAGKPGWAAIIPIYNYIVFLEIVGKPIWWIFLILFPCTTIIFYIWSLNLLSKSFGQSEGFTIGLLFLPFIFFPILGFGNYPYLGPAGAGFAGAPTYDPGKDYQDPFQTNPPQA